jgi:hypothetical protein
MSHAKRLARTPRRVLAPCAPRGAPAADSGVRFPSRLEASNTQRCLDSMERPSVLGPAPVSFPELRCARTRRPFRPARPTLRCAGMRSTRKPCGARPQSVQATRTAAGHGLGSLAELPVPVNDWPAQRSQPRGLPRTITARPSACGDGSVRRVAEVDDAEAIAVWVREHDEVRVVGVAVPADSFCPEDHEARCLGCLLGRTGCM